MTTLIIRAKQYAAAAHDSINHRRKYTDEPYIVHPEKVAHMVAQVTNDNEVIAAAWLHDVIEDVYPKNNYYSLENIKYFFGERVASLVAALTDASKRSDGNRDIRKAIDREHIAKAPAEAKTIKLADIIDNTESIVKYGRGFARIYLAEMELLLPVLNEGDARLYQRAASLIKESQIFLANKKTDNIN